MSVYVFGVVAKDGHHPLPPGTRTIAHGDLAAVVRDLPEGTTPGRREDLETHHKVLSDLVAERGVLPMRFGIVMGSDDEVRSEVLERHGERLKSLLGWLGDRVQMTIKAYYQRDVAVREAAAADPRIPELARAVEGRDEQAARDERIALGQLVAAGVEAIRERDEERVTAALSAADDVRAESPADPEMAAHVHVLVRRDQRAKLDAAVDRLAAEQEGRLAIRYLGPLPPYSFADLNLEEAGAWAS